MSNFQHFGVQSRTRELKLLHGEIDIGALGAPTLVSKPGFSSIVRNSAGNYTITLEGKYPDIISADLILEAAAAEDIQFQLESRDVANGQITFRCLTGGVETDPSNGSKILIEAKVKRTSVSR